MRLTLKKRILVPTTVLLVLVMAVSTAITYFFFWKSLNANITNELSDIAKSKVELIDVWIEDFKTLVQTSAVRSVYVASLKEETEQARDTAMRSLAEQVKISPGLSYINVINLQGEVRASSIPESVGKVKVADRDYFQKALKGQVNVSTVYLARTTGKPAFAVAAPVRDGDRIIGVVAGVPDLTKFNEKFIDSAKVLDTGYVTIADASGIVFANKDASLVMKMNLNDFDFGRDMLKLKQGHLAYSSANRNYLAYLEPCKAADWMLAVIAPYQEVIQDARRMALINVTVVASGLVLIVILLYLIAHSIARPISRVVDGLSDGSDQVATAASQVSSASQKLAEGASQQAASIEETSSSLEEMSSMTRQNARNADLANNAMHEVSRVVDLAHSSMGELEASMDEISKASVETQKIIKTIDEIAFQTNLLALNAAVEAARAGEAGAGFAVVADEVRNLAMRAAEAAKNTAGLIEATVAKVKRGSDIAGRALSAFGEVNASSKKVAGLVGEIAEGSKEQAQGIEQINKAVSEMDKVVQQNAANAEESAAASEELNVQAEQMMVFVGGLVNIVGTDAGGRKEGREAAAKETVIAKITPKPLVRFGRRPASKRDEKALAVRETGGKEIKPAEVIPFEEDDYTEF